MTGTSQSRAFIPTLGAQQGWLVNRLSRRRADLLIQALAPLQLSARGAAVLSAVRELLPPITQLEIVAGLALNYTTWRLVSAVGETPEPEEPVRVVMENVGKREAREVVKVCLVPDSIPCDFSNNQRRPARLVGFGAETGGPGDVLEAVVSVDLRAAGRFDPSEGWTPIAGGC